MKSVSGAQPRVTAYFPCDSVRIFGSLILLRPHSPQANTQRETYLFSCRNVPLSWCLINTREQTLLLLYRTFAA